MNYDRDLYQIDDGSSEEEVRPGWRAGEQEVITGPVATRRARTAYDPKYNPIAMRLCKGGYTDAELAETFGVHVATIYRWKAEFPDFAEACKLGKEEVDDRVEQALLRRAVGYEYRSEKVFQYEGTPIRVPVIEHVQPDVKAQSLWLRNRRRAEWRETMEHTGAGGTPLIPSDPVQIREVARYYAFIFQQGAQAAIQIEDSSNGT
jgi:hypothetical protein